MNIKLTDTKEDELKITVGDLIYNIEEGTLSIVKASQERDQNGNIKMGFTLDSIGDIFYHSNKFLYSSLVGLYRSHSDLNKYIIYSKDEYELYLVRKSNKN